MSGELATKSTEEEPVAEITASLEELMIKDEARCVQSCS